MMHENPFFFCKKSEEIFNRFNTDKEYARTHNLDGELHCAYPGRDWYKLRFLEEVKRTTMNCQAMFIDADWDSEDYQKYIWPGRNEIRAMKSFEVKTWELWWTNPFLVSTISVIPIAIYVSQTTEIEPLISLLFTIPIFILLSILVKFTDLFGGLLLSKFEVTWDYNTVRELIVEADSSYHKETEREKIFSAINDHFNSF